MNYYEHHLGDYAKATGHLTALEHGIYRLLLDWYYANERPIPDAQAHRYGKASRAEVEPILAEFFVRDGDVWRHNRADREIAAFYEKANKARGAAQARWSGKAKPEPCERNADALQAHTDSNADGMPSRLQTPVSIHQKDQDQEQAPQAAEKPRRRGTRLPTDWQPSPADLDFIASKRPELDPVTTADNFRDFWHAKAGKDACKTDWAATWRNWVRNQRANPQTRAGPPQSLQAQVKAANRAAIERMINEGSDVVSGGNRPRLGQFLGDRVGEPARIGLAGAHDPDVD